MAIAVPFLFVSSALIVQVKYTNALAAEDAGIAASVTEPLGLAILLLPVYRSDLGVASSRFYLFRSAGERTSGFSHSAWKCRRLANLIFRKFFLNSSDRAGFEFYSRIGKRE